MPLQGTAKDVMRRMKQQYGKDAEKVFYATANKKGLVPETWQKKESADLTPYDPRTWDKKQWQSAGATGGAIVGLYALYKLLKSEPEQAPYGY